MIRERKVFHEGKKFGRLKALEYIYPHKYLCLCECGTKKVFNSGALTSGTTISCGCYRSIHAKDYKEVLKERLLKNILINENGCWVWQKSKHRQGYGNVAFKRKCRLAHRVSWEIFKGNLDKDILVCHKCDNPPCINPDHLFLGTDRDNSLDAFAKGRIQRYKGSDHYYSKLNDENVIAIRNMRKKGKTQEYLSKVFSVNISTIKDVLSRRSWMHLP